MREITVKVHKFQELPANVQNSIIKKRQQINGEYFDGKDCIYDDVATIAGLFGLEFDQRHIPLMNGSTRPESAIYYSGFWSQGDGACFEGTYRYKKGALKTVKEYAPQDTTLHQIVTDLQYIQAKHFFL